MKIPSLAKCAGAVVALAIVSACGGGAVTPSGGNATAGYVGTSMVATIGAHQTMRAMPGYPVIVPDRMPRSKYYEYIIDDYGTYAGIFDYPKGTAAIGYINNVGGQGCTHVFYGYGKKTFWIVAGNTQITEYAVPKKPLKTLSTSAGAPSSCAMNSSGDLAVGILYASGSGGGDVVIYKNATGTGKVYTTPLRAEYFDGYDPKGNLFADGFSNSGFELVELAKGSTTFVPVKTSNTVAFPGSVQWDGTYLDVTDQQANAMYQYTVSGNTATLQGTVQFSGSSDCAQTWIATGVVYCADAGNNDGYVFNYPAGGSPLATFTGNFDLPLGTVAAKR